MFLHKRMFRDSFIHLFIHSFILETYIAPHQETTTQRRYQPSDRQRRWTWKRCKIWKGGPSEGTAAQRGDHSMLMVPMWYVYLKWSDDVKFSATDSQLRGWLILKILLLWKFYVVAAQNLEIPFLVHYSYYIRLLLWSSAISLDRFRKSCRKGSLACRSMVGTTRSPCLVLCATLNPANQNSHSQM